MKKFLFFTILSLILSLLLTLIYRRELILNALTKVIVLNFANKASFNLKLNESTLMPKIYEKRIFEVNLTENKIYFFENGKLKIIIPIAYQSPYGKWYQTPTGYFRVGVKKENHISSLFPVYMNYAVQMYEDFFIHEIPYYLNGKKVTSEFTGGCIRLENNDAKVFFELAKQGDLIISYATFKNLKIKKDFASPINHQEFFIRQKFNNPLRINYYRLENRKIDYIQHAGLDLAPLPNANDLNVYSIFDGKIAKIILNGNDDHGLGNTIIIEHKIEKSKIYSLYGHLQSIDPKLKEGEFIKKGQIIGKVGATGFGCNYWRIGKDGCKNNNPLDIHLHFEIKTKPLLESPKVANCKINNKESKCYGYTPDNPDKFGYYDPLLFLFDKN